MSVLTTRPIASAVHFADCSSSFQIQRSALPVANVFEDFPSLTWDFPYVKIPALHQVKSGSEGRHQKASQELDSRGFDVALGPKNLLIASAHSAVWRSLGKIQKSVRGRDIILRA
jgi:hypothetical protein